LSTLRAAVVALPGPHSGHLACSGTGGSGGVFGAARSQGRSAASLSGGRLESGLTLAAPEGISTGQSPQGPRDRRPVPGPCDLVRAMTGAESLMYALVASGTGACSATPGSRRSASSQPSTPSTTCSRVWPSWRTVMRYPSPVDPDGPTINSHHVGRCCVVDGGAVLEVVGTRVSGSGSFS
jgi:hypothetical protein